MKIAHLFVLSSVVLLSCNQKKDTAFLVNHNRTDSLFAQNTNRKPEKEKKVGNQKLAHEIIENPSFVENDKFVKQALVFYDAGNNDKYLYLLKKLYKQSISKEDYNGISESSYYIANYYYNEAKYDSAYFYFTKAENSFLKIKDKVLLASYIKNIRANILTFKKDYVGAEKLSIEALKVAKEEKFNLLIYDCYITLGNSLDGVKNYDKAIEYYKKAIEATDDLKLEPEYLMLKAMPYNYIANIYRKEKEYENSIKVVEQALRFDNFKKNNTTVYCYLINTLAYSKFKLGDESSQHQFFEVLKIADSTNNIPVQITSRTYLGEYFLVKKDTLRAISYFKDAQAQAHSNSIFEDELKILKFLAQANPNDKSFYSNRYISLNDSLQYVERDTRNKFARIEFETDEITTERDSLTLKAENLSLQRWVIIAVAVLSIVIIVFWFMSKSQKAKTIELLLKQEQQKANEDIYQLMLSQHQKIQEGKNIEKQRISLELHDGVMGKLSAVRLNLYAALYKSKLINDQTFSLQIDEIQAVEQEIRNIAHNLNSNLFSDNSNFIAIVKELYSKIENHSRIQFNLEVSDAINFDLINNTIKINLYRILQEALQNIEKYAEASHVEIVMTQINSGHIEVIISDDGKGFSPHHRISGIGIENMKIRIHELGGTFSIESELNRGTKIDLTIPF